MGVTLALEFGLVGFGFAWRDLFLFEVRLGVIAVVVAPYLLSARLRKMRRELQEAAAILRR